jgi:hypothetical protein
MNYIKNLNEITDLQAVAEDIADLLEQTSNADIAVEFPSSVAAYTGDINKVVDNLIAVQGESYPGVRQQFIACSGLRAVGMSVVRFADKVPDGVDIGWPNVSGFVCNPFRGRGIGRLSLMKRLEAIDAQFGGSAWTRIKVHNVHSQQMVEHAGFVQIGMDTEGLIYTYNSA